MDVRPSVQEQLRGVGTPSIGGINKGRVPTLHHINVQRNTSISSMNQRHAYAHLLAGIPYPCGECSPLGLTTTPQWPYTLDQRLKVAPCSPTKSHSHSNTPLHTRLIPCTQHRSMTTSTLSHIISVVNISRPVQEPPHYDGISVIRCTAQGSVPILYKNDTPSGIELSYSIHHHPE